MRKKEDGEVSEAKPDQTLDDIGGLVGELTPLLQKREVLAGGAVGLLGLFSLGGKKKDKKGKPKEKPKPKPKPTVKPKAKPTVKPKVTQKTTPKPKPAATKAVQTPYKISSPNKPPTPKPSQYKPQPSTPLGKPGDFAKKYGNKVEPSKGGTTNNPYLTKALPTRAPKMLEVLLSSSDRLLRSTGDDMNIYAAALLGVFTGLIFSVLRFRNPAGASKEPLLTTR